MHVKANLIILIVAWFTAFIIKPPDILLSLFLSNDSKRPTEKSIGEPCFRTDGDLLVSRESICNCWPVHKLAKTICRLADQICHSQWDHWRALILIMPARIHTNNGTLSFTSWKLAISKRSPLKSDTNPIGSMQTVMRDCATAFVSHLKSSLLSQYLSSWESNRVWHEDLKSRKIEIGTVKFDCVKRDSFFTQIVQELPGSSRTGLSQGFQETMTESGTRNRAIYIFVAVCHLVVLCCIGLQFILTMAKDSKIALNKFERIQRERAVRGLENAVDQH